MSVRRTRARAAPVLVFAVGLAAAFLALASRPAGVSQATTVGSDELLTPVLSARRVPGLVAREVADRNLRNRLDSALADPMYGSVARDSCLVASQGERQIHAVRPDLALIPASNLKLLTAAAVLAHFGPDHVFVTELKTRTAPVDGVVDGPAWLVGGGDPLLMTNDYAASFRNQPQLHTPISQLVASARAAGVREISGGVLGDEGRYDTVRYLPTWRPNYISDGEVGPASALLVDDGFTEYSPRKLAAANPARHAATVLTDALRASGVAVGVPGVGKAPAEVVTLGRVESAPLAEIVKELLSESDNTTAELLTKELGFARAGTGTTEAGLAEIREILEPLGIATASYISTDGSGLDRANRATCSSVNTALTIDGLEGPIGRGLAVAAETGTLSRRFQGTPAAGRLMAKTGALAGVTGLSGWVAVPAAAPVDFTFLANGILTEARGRALQERIGVAISLYPEAPDVASLSPLLRPSAG